MLKKNSKYTKAQAKKDSLKKWEFLTKKTYRTCFDVSTALEKKHPELQNLWSNCGFCELIKRGKEKKPCPLNPECTDCGHCIPEFYEWYRKRTKENAQKVLAKIKAIKVIKRAKR